MSYTDASLHKNQQEKTHKYNTLLRLDVIQWMY
jgi:hypothetical protein